MCASGFATFAQQDTYPMDTLIQDQLPMCSQTICEASGRCICSAGLPDGVSQPALLDGQTTANCGQAPRRASRSRSPAKAKPRLTIGTCGPTCFASPVPDGPLSSWESRLRQRLARTGSTESLLTWKVSATPAGRPLSLLRPSMRPTEGTACGLWPTPTASLADKAIRTPEGARTEVDRGKSPDLNAQVMALWQTPVADDSVNRVKGKWNSRGEPKLSGQVMAMWPTPSASGFEAKDPERLLQRRAECKERTGNGNGFGLTLGQFACLEAHGVDTAGSSATTEKPGALAPEFVAWLMGFPPEWLACAPETMPRKPKSK